MTPLLSTAYWPNLHYFYYVLNNPKVVIEQFDNYQKQSFRNRTQLLSANGILALTIPIKNNGPKVHSRNIEISYSEKWQNKHWRAISSAYKNSPYFDYFEEDIRVFYDRNYDRLFDYNLGQLYLVLKLLKQTRVITPSESFEKKPALFFDARELIHPKKDYTEDLNVSRLLEVKYYQTFEAKFEFKPNLSILDLLFNKGIETLDYLTRTK